MQYSQLTDPLNSALAALQDRHPAASQGSHLAAPQASRSNTLTDSRWNVSLDGRQRTRPDDGSRTPLDAARYTPVGGPSYTPIGDRPYRRNLDSRWSEYSDARWYPREPIRPESRGYMEMDGRYYYHSDDRRYDRRYARVNSREHLELVDGRWLGRERTSRGYAPYNGRLYGSADGPSHQVASLSQDGYGRSGFAGQFPGSESMAGQLPSVNSMISPAHFPTQVNGGQQPYDPLSAPDPARLHDTRAGPPMASDSWSYGDTPQQSVHPYASQHNPAPARSRGVMAGDGPLPQDPLLLSTEFMDVNSPFSDSIGTPHM